MDNRKQIRFGAMISYAAIIISTLSALLYTPWMKNQIGDSNYGIYTLVTSLIAIFMMDFGLGTTVTRFVAKYRASNNQAAVNDILGQVFKLYICIDVIITIVLFVLFFFLESIYTGLNAAEIETLKKVYIVFASYSVFAFPFAPLAGVLNAYERFTELKLCDLFQKLFAIVLIVIALLNGQSVTVLVLMNAVSGVATIIIKLRIIGKGKLIRPNFHVKDRAITKNLLGFSVWVMVLAFSQRLIFNIAPSILGITSNSMEIARFAPASQLEGYFFTFAYAINGLFLPTIARYDYAEDAEKIDALFQKVARYQICVLGLLFTGIAVLGSDFMALWMGGEYRICGFCTTLMILPSLVQYPQQIANTLLSVRNMIKYQAASALLIGLLNVALSLVLTPKYGALGSSISICVAYSVNYILLNIVYVTKLKLNMKSFYKNIYARYLPLIAVCIAVLIPLTDMIPFAGWIGMLVKVLLCIVIYVLVIGLIGFSSSERKNGIRRIKTKIFAK